MVAQFLVDLGRFLSNALAKSTPVSAAQEAGSYTQVRTYHVPLTPAQLWNVTLLYQHPATFTKQLPILQWQSLPLQSCIPDCVHEGVPRVNSSNLNGSPKVV